MKAVTVLGGTGLLGANLVKELLKDEIPLRLQFRTETKKQFLIDYLIKNEVEERLLNQIQWIQGDIKSINDLEKILDNTSLLYHCANQVSFDERDRKSLMQNNFVGTQNVVNIALEKKIDKMLYVSSVACLDAEPESTTISEKSQWDSEKVHTSYADSKYLAELEVWRGIEEGLNAVIINPVVVLSDYDFNSSSGLLFKNFHKPFLFYNKEGRFSFVDVEDVVARMVFLMNSQYHSQRYIISGGAISMEHMCDIFIKAYGKGKKVEISKVWLKLAKFFNTIFDYLLPFLRKYSNSFFDIFTSHYYYEHNKLDEIYSEKYMDISTSLFKYAKDYQQKLSSK